MLINSQKNHVPCPRILLLLSELGLSRGKEVKRLRASENWQYEVAVRLGAAVRTTAAHPGVTGADLRTGPPPIVHYEPVVGISHVFAIQCGQYLFDSTCIRHVNEFLPCRHFESMQILTADAEYLVVGVVCRRHGKASLLCLLPDEERARLAIVVVGV